MITGYVFVLCEPGARMTDQFEAIGDELEQCNWYTLPIKMQQLYIIFLADTQNSINITSFAGIECTRETSKKVIAVTKSLN